MKKRRSKNLFIRVFCCICFVAFFGVQVAMASEATGNQTGQSGGDSAAGDETGQQSGQEPGTEDETQKQADEDTSEDDESGEQSGQRTAGSSSGLSAGSVRAVGGERQRARQVTDEQQELAHQIAEREEARTRQMER